MSADTIANIRPTKPAALAQGDLPPHVLRLARMIARDCSSPGEYVIHLTIPDRPTSPAIIQTAKVDVIRDATAERK